MKYFFVRPGKRVTKTLSVLYDTHLNKGWNAVFSKEAVDTKIKLQKKQQQIINQQLIKNQMVVQEANIHNQFTEESWAIEHSNHIDQWVRVKNYFVESVFCHYNCCNYRLNSFL